MLFGVDRGILGGTFDPPHFAHLFAGEAAFRQVGLDVVTFIPAGAPWQKADSEVSAAEHRLTMTKLAVDDVPYFEVDDREVGRDGWTYTIDTLRTFPASDRLTLILGADAAAGLGTWRDVDALLRRVRIAVVPRPGVARRVVDAALDGAEAVWLDGPELDVSGTALRQRVQRGLPIRFLVPDPVWSYIEEHRLYRSPVTPVT